MKYMGSKARIAKYIIPFINQELKNKDFYVEPFVGGSNIIDKINFKRKIGADINQYLIAMWKGLQDGSFLPPSFISKEFYSQCRDAYNRGDSPSSILGYVGFNGSYGGRFYDGGYAGITKDKYGKERNYPYEAYLNVIKQIKNFKQLKNTEFICSNFINLEIHKNSLVYCDPQYKNTKQYSQKTFNHDIFFNWCREIANKGSTVLVSEYECPDDFKCIWQMEVSSSLRANSVISGNKKSIEKLFILNK